MTPRIKVPACVVVMVLFHGCATAWVRTPAARPVQGVASWYGEEFAGRVTASGEIFDPYEFTAAHLALPFGTIAAITNLETGDTVEVRINDRGPFVGKRIIDLSYAAAQKIGLAQQGIGMVELKVVRLGDGRRIRLQDKPEPVVETVDAEPPSVPFPLPSQVRSPISETAAADSEFEVELIEERSGVPARRRVAASGRELETVPIEGGTALPLATPAPPVSERYVLQLGAFQMEKNAEALRARAATVQKDVYIEQSMGFFRVRLGPFASQARALEIQEELRAADIPSLLLTE